MKVSIAFCYILLCLAYFDIIAAYSVSGNKILDKNGNQVIIRGIDRPSMEWECTGGQYMSLADYMKMQSWGANMIRLSLSECCLLSGLTGYNPAYAAAIDQQVAWIKQLGMGVILDLHWSNMGQAAGTCGQQAMADSYSVTFWTTIATKYKNDDMIIFELYNEPFTSDWNIWQNGGTVSGSPSWTAVGMQTLYTTVRNTGANNVIIIGGINYAYDLSGVAAHTIVGTNIVYNTHPYNYPGKQPSDWQTSFGYLFNQYPLIATEFGDTTVGSCATSYYSSFLTYAQQNSMSWTSWGWWVANCQFPSMITDWNGTASAAGVLVKQALLAGPGVITGQQTTQQQTTQQQTTQQQTTQQQTTQQQTTQQQTTQQQTTQQQTTQQPTTTQASGAGCQNMFTLCKQICNVVDSCKCVNGQPVVVCGVATSAASSLRPFWGLF